MALFQAIYQLRDMHDIISGNGEDLVSDWSRHGHHRATDQDCQDTDEQNT